MNLTSPKNWKMVKLGDVASIKHGYAFKGEYFSETPTNKILLTPGNFSIGGGWKEGKKFYNEVGEIPEDYILDSGDLVVSMTDLSKEGDTLGYSALVPNDPLRVFLHNQRVGLVKNNEDLSYKNFLYYLLRSRSYQRYVVNTATGSTVKHTSPTKILEYEFPLPTLDEQKEIAAILGSLDEKIELLRRENKTLENIAQALFREWFVEFRFPGYEGVKVEDGVPEGWKVGKLTDVAEFLNGVASQKYPAENKNESLPVIKIREMKSGITADTDRATSKIDLDYIIKSGDMLFSWSGSLDIVLWNDIDGVLNQHLFKVTSENYPKWFYYYWVLQHLPEFKSIAESKATTMGHIQRHHLDNAEVLIPGEKTFAIMNCSIIPLLDKQILNNSEIRNLSRLRDQLLDKIFSN